MSRVRRKIKIISYSTDYDPASPETATWVDGDSNNLFADGASPFTENPEYADLMDGRRVQTDADGEATYPYAYDPSDSTFTDGLRTALNAGTPVWIKETYIGGESIVVGGDAGVTGAVTTAEGPFLMQSINVTATGAVAGDAYTFVDAP